jgi:hypothetical protein
MIMTCEQFQAIVQDLESRGALDEATSTLAQFHAQTCESCGARLAQSRSLTAGLRALEASQAADGAPARVEAILRSAFLRQKWETARAKTMRRWAAAGIAAVLLLTAGLASRLVWKSAAPAGTARAESATATIPSLQVPTGAGAVTPGATRATGGAVHENNTGGGQSEDDLAADFVPYPAGGSILPFESAQIVRVNLPGSALVAMGFPIDGDRAGERFTADVLVGEDGLPRAIRFPQ